MVKVNSMLAKRLKNATEKLSKMTSLAHLSSSGNLSSFSGLFRVTPLSDFERHRIESILSEYSQGEKQDIQDDLLTLANISSEVKAINNQAAILHGERIKKAQEILKKYRDGAFSAWLIATYGNRQTPYNFLQYFELYRALPHILHSKLEEMPRQVIYALASRSGSLNVKEEIIKNYRGEPKQELLSLIRQTFPLAQEDRRAQDIAELIISSLKRLQRLFHEPHFVPTEDQKRRLCQLLDAFKSYAKQDP
ncbi:MAG: hypothetical protein A3D18_02470 [Chlamydiae bacterium RIFCSPHIGHO2_02_FULL_49_29]|nr:MAG: hypothetical protein A3D18_02470 [Chlamydiae bacterium RIFCSPHIGHO2_02_FULL_49_29]